jgi:hypothetical protein
VLSSGADRRPVSGSQEAPRGADGLVGVGGPFGDRGERPRAGQHRRSGHRKDRDQRVAAAAAGSGVGDRGEIAQQMRWFRCSRRVAITKL